MLMILPPGDLHKWIATKRRSNHAVKLEAVNERLRPTQATSTPAYSAATTESSIRYICRIGIIPRLRALVSKSNIALGQRSFPVPNSDVGSGTEQLR